jgi:hypothetical protein
MDDRYGRPGGRPAGAATPNTAQRLIPRIQTTEWILAYLLDQTGALFVCTPRKAAIIVALVGSKFDYPILPRPSPH